MEHIKEIQRARLIETFTELIRINSPSFEEGAIGSVLSRRLKRLGFRVLRQDYGRSFNLLAMTKGSRENAVPLLLNAHMDTIEPTKGIRFSMKNGVIKSTGDTVLGADDKSAIAQILEALMVIREKKIPHGPIEIALTSAEEKGLVGVRNIDFDALKSTHALVLDSGGSVGRIVTAAPTHHTYEMKITGKPAHAGIEPEKGISAIRIASEIIAAVPDGRIDDVTTANIGLISGGTATNVVPREVMIKGEVRSHRNATLNKVKDTIFRTARQIAGKRGGRFAVTCNEEYRSFRIREKDPFMRFMAGVFGQCGITPEFTVTGGGSDANVLNQRGIKAVNISTGMQAVHSTDEYIRIDDLVNGCGIVLKAIIEFPAFSRGQGTPGNRQ